ncbi:hypothetical protein E3P99_01232 [Wallemia hederae]|uniref:DH domain-containing protein n=1 Tax=Wallemia hederae TaxID=1540922 RepID=A0A4T0FQU9_9BASI|nr:hypothetical protein E3P99_01232 [Wallemia hederae]
MSDEQVTPRQKPVKSDVASLPRPKSTIELSTPTPTRVPSADAVRRRQRSHSDAIDRTHTSAHVLPPHQVQAQRQQPQPQSSSRLGEFFGRFRSSSTASLGDDTTGTTTASTSSSAVMVSRPVSRPVSQQSDKSSTWSSLINHEALESFSAVERNRQEAIYELIKSEAVYVQDLTAIVEVFLANMIPEVDAGLVEIIFSNIEDLLLLNATFVSDLESRQRNDRMYISQIGDLLDKHLGSLDIYMHYCSNQHRSIKALQSLQNNNYRLSQKLLKLKAHPTSRNLDLSTHLLSPMQRITRYPLLVRQILKHTDPGTVEYESIEKALKAVETLLLAINEDVRVQESHTRLLEISNTLVMSQKVDLSSSADARRILIKEGELAKSKSSKVLHLVLCNDILLLINVVERTLYKLPIPLREVAALAHAKREDILVLELAYPRGGESIALKTAPQDRDAWINTINTTQKQLTR